MINTTLKKDCKDVFNFLLKAMNKDQIKKLTYILNTIKDDFPAENGFCKIKMSAKENILPFKEISGLRVYSGGKN